MLAQAEFGFNKAEGDTAMSTKSIITVVTVSIISAMALLGVILVSALRAPVEVNALRNPVERAPAPDKNGPGVVRVSVVVGSAVVQRGDSHVQTNAVRNAPLLPGDFISTGKMSRAELQFDGYTAVRLGGGVQARIVSDGRSDRKVQLAGGTVEVGMVHDGQTMQIDTPSVSVRAHQTGDIRISIAVDGSSWVTTRRGGAEVVTPQRTYTLGTGSTLIARGSASDPSVSDAPGVAFDSFDDFNAERDKTMLAALNASPYLNPSLAGYDDLGAYGHWQSVAGYGQSWMPNEPAGWVPYRNGSWTWEDRYGWTWIGDEAWGWAPYHYGNWYYCSCGGSGWAWLPPAVGATPAWSPALVGFFGFDTGNVADVNCPGNYGYAPGTFSAPSAPAPAENAVAQGPAAPSNSGAPAPYGEGGPSPSGPGFSNPPGPGGFGPGPGPGGYPYIGWVPIAPFQPFYPWWPSFGFGFGFGYPLGFATNITNITNIRNVTNIYRNFRHGGATATTMRHFRHGTVHGHTVAVTSRDLGRRFGTIHGALPVKPTRDNLSFSHGTVRAPVRFSKAFNSTRFASDRTLSARTPFAQQQKVVARAIHDGLTGHAPAHAAARIASAPATRSNATRPHVSSPVTHANLPETRANAFEARRSSPLTRANSAMPRANAFEPRGNQVEARHPENAPVTRENAAPAARVNAAPMRENSASMRENSAPMRQNNAPMREGSAPSRQVEGMRNELGPSAPWDRFNEARGESRAAAFPAGSGGATSGRGAREGDLPAPSEGGRAPSDSWGRFSAARGESYEGSHSRNPYENSYSRGSEPSYSRGEHPSYSRGEYPSNSRGGYPSYSRGEYPSYSRPSYPSYSRGSYPSSGSYYRGGGAPSYSRGGGGYSAPHSSGGGGARGRPPH
jgi:hypothetical protein